MAPTAVVVGCTGIIGLPLSKRLLADGWKVYGISRRKQDFLPAAINHVSLDLLDESDCKKQLGALSDVSHVFFSAWVDRKLEEENIKVNQQMLVNVLDSFKQKLKHVVLVTGQKHYIGSFEYFFSLKQEDINAIHPSDLKCPFREDNPRLPIKNFYYNQEDVLWDRAAKKGFKWNVVRPPTVIGFAPYNAMNLATSVAVYAMICKELNVPFKYPGSAAAYDSYTDHVQSDVVADSILWQVNEPKAANQAFNVGNGDLVRWRWMWKAIADYFGVPIEEPDTMPIDLVEWAKDKDQVWDQIVQKNGLKPLKLGELTNYWFVNAAIGFSITSFNSLSKIREFGYTNYLDSEKGMLSVFDFLKENKYI